MKRKPDLYFLVAGFSKCGTTSLCSLLNEHPDIFIPSIKEPNFFSLSDYEDKWPWYGSLFDASQSSQRLGEGSTFYTNVEFEEQSCRAILKHYPKVKLIFIARDPIKRIQSSFREHHHSGPRFGIDTPFDMCEALKQFPNLLRDTMYWSRLTQYLKHFPKEQLHFALLEELEKDPAKEIAACHAFLNIEQTNNGRVKTREQRLNTGDQKLRDSRLLRQARNTPVIGPAISKISIPTQDKIFSKLHLRVAFGDQFELDDQLKDTIWQALKDDIPLFLDHIGKSASIWPHYSQLAQQMIK